MGGPEPFLRSQGGRQGPGHQRARAVCVCVSRKWKHQEGIGQQGPEPVRGRATAPGDSRVGGAACSFPHLCGVECRWPKAPRGFVLRQSSASPRSVPTPTLTANTRRAGAPLSCDPHPVTPSRDPPILRPPCAAMTRTSTPLVGPSVGRTPDTPAERPAGARLHAGPAPAPCSPAVGAPQELGGCPSVARLHV